MTKPYGLPKSKVHEPWNDRCPFSKKAERDKYRFRKKTARQLAKKEIENAPADSHFHPDEIEVCNGCGDSHCEEGDDCRGFWRKGVEVFPELAGNALKVPVFRFFEIDAELLDDLEDTIKHIGKTDFMEMGKRKKLVKHARKIMSKMRGKSEKNRKRNSRRHKGSAPKAKRV